MISRMRKRRNSALKVSAIAATSIALTATPAAAYQGWGVVLDTNRAYEYTGLQVQRKDNVVTGLNNTGCSAFFDGQPLFQQQTLELNSGNGIILGTGHQCLGNKNYWYWGYLYEGEYIPLGEMDNITLGTTRYFRVHRTGGMYWSFKIDSATVGWLDWSTDGAEHVWAGIDSRDQTGTVVSTQSDLAVRLNDSSTYQPWGGQDAEHASPSADMCANFLTNTTAKVGGNSQSC